MKSLPTGLSRRALVQNAGIVAGAGLLGLGSSPAAESPSPRGKPRALALIGDRYHNPDYIRVSLDKVFQDLGISIDYATSPWHMPNQRRFSRPSTKPARAPILNGGSALLVLVSSSDLDSIYSRS